MYACIYVYIYIYIYTHVESATGYESESRAIAPGGSAVVFIWAFNPSPIGY
jgi:hypothetical protein